MARELGADQQEVVKNKDKYLADARARGMTQERIDSFLSENANDYQRLQDIEVGNEPAAPEPLPPPPPPPQEQPPVPQTPVRPEPAAPVAPPAPTPQISEAPAPMPTPLSITALGGGVPKTPAVQGLSAGGGSMLAQAAEESPSATQPVISGTVPLRQLSRRTLPQDSMALAGLRKIY